MPDITQWRRERLGYVTASRFRDILTEPRAKKAREAGEWSEKARSYMIELVTERITGEPCDLVTSRSTQWGIDWEQYAYAQAREYLERRHKCLLPETKQLEFVRHRTEKWIGCSPDGTVFADVNSLLELKCPANPTNHMRTILQGGMPAKHDAQIQGSLWITNMEEYWFGSFDPRFHSTSLEWWCTTADRDQSYIDAIVPRILRFRDWVGQEYSRLIEVPF